MFDKSKKQEIKEQKKKDEDWMTKKWRPMMAIMYMICCLCDFAIFPIMFTIVQFWETAVQNDAFRQWVPITLQGGGLFHVAMGAVLGVSAYGRTQEKVAGAAGGAPALPAGLPAVNLPTPGGSNNGFNTPQGGAPAFGAPATGFGAATGGFGAPAPVANPYGAQPTGGFGGNPGFGAPTFGATGADFGSPAGVTVGFGGKKAPPEFPQPLI